MIRRSRSKCRAKGVCSLWGQVWIPLQQDLFVRDDGKRLLGFAPGCRGHDHRRVRRLLASRGTATLAALAFRRLDRGRRI